MFQLHFSEKIFNLQARVSGFGTSRTPISLFLNCDKGRFKKDLKEKRTNATEEDWIRPAMCQSPWKGGEKIRSSLYRVTPSPETNIIYWSISINHLIINDSHEVTNFSNCYGGNKKAKNKPPQHIFPPKTNYLFCIKLSVKMDGCIAFRQGCST